MVLVVGCGKPNENQSTEVQEDSNPSKELEYELTDLFPVLIYNNDTISYVPDGGNYYRPPQTIVYIEDTFKGKLYHPLKRLVFNDDPQMNIKIGVRNDTSKWSLPDSYIFEKDFTIQKDTGHVEFVFRDVFDLVDVSKVRWVTRYSNNDTSLIQYGDFILDEPSSEPQQE